MKQLSFLSSIFIFFILASCSNEDPEYPVFMQPSSIQSLNADADNQTFEYDEYGRIVNWTQKRNNPSDATIYTAKYSYPNNNAIHVVSEESWLNQKRCYEETIQMVDCRASKSEGTFIYSEGDNVVLKKTYHLEYEYDSANHLTVVKHTEVVGIGEDIPDVAWNKPWSWENYLIWEDGNLKEFQDYYGNVSVYKTTKYDYSIEAVDYPVIMPMVINNAHHMPLFMQGVFGLNSVNLVKSSSVIDNEGNITFSCQYTYKFEQARIVGYTQTYSFNTTFSNSVTYNVNWTER